MLLHNGDGAMYARRTSVLAMHTVILSSKSSGTKAVIYHNTNVTTTVRQFHSLGVVDFLQLLDRKCNIDDCQQMWRGKTSTGLG